MDRPVSTTPDLGTLIEAYRKVRRHTELLCEPLAAEDYQVQSIDETSPPKWHIAHVTWFFETFVLSRYAPGYAPYRREYDYLFNSYYYTHGQMHPRPRRGMLSRPIVGEVFDYRARVDEAVTRLLEEATDRDREELYARITLGLHHEQQHQELLLMDVKHNFSVNPLKPAYREDLAAPPGETRPARWIEREGGIEEVGHAGGGFAFDNETPRHTRLLRDHRLADRFVTNGEYLAFIDDGGYDDPALWLSDGWSLIQGEGWRHPLYWEARDGWRQFTLGGMRDLNPHEPVCHLSYYEADAYARWAGKRLPLEEELETLLARQPIAGNFVDSGYLHPAPAGGNGQWFGDLWAWTASPYTAYPGFKPLGGAMGEYNGKFMSNQMVLKGGCCLTPADHVRSSYRNFFYPRDRWPCTGLRLAEDA